MSKLLSFHGCGVGVGDAGSRRFLGAVGVGFLRTLEVGVGVGVGFFYPTPTLEVQLNHFVHRIPKLGIPTRACWNGAISFQTFIEAASCYKIVDSQTSFTLCQGVAVGDFGKVGVGHFTSEPGCKVLHAA